MRKVAPQLVKFVEKNSCDSHCAYTMEINNGLPLECLTWTTSESTILSERMLRDNELLTSGFVCRLNRSDLGNRNKYSASGIDIGEVRTQDSGAPDVTECKITFNPITFADFEKEFYVVNTELNTRMCVKNFIGKKQQELISNQLSTYEVAEEFANTDLAMIIVAKIIQKFQDFLPEFMLLASKGGSGKNLHGDDGILAKAFYAEQGVYFHTIQYDLSDVVSGTPDTYINAIVGGARYDTDPAAFASPDLYILDFVEWLNSLKEKRDFMFDVTFDAANNTVVVASNFITRQIDLKVVLNDGSVVDWACAEADMLPFTQLQGRILINDKPQSFQYEKIDNSNFFNKFKEYKKQFMIHLHNNGHSDVSIDQMLIGIDPLLMLEREDYIASQTLAGNFNATSIDSIGFNFGQFKPLNALTDTGLFFMSTPGNILQLSDDTDFSAQTRIRESKCADKEGEIEILGGVPPVGSDVEAWGRFASNITDSWFVLDNKLSERQPYAATMKNLQCYDANVRNGCAVASGCQIFSNVTTEVAYNPSTLETTITVSIDSSLNVDGTLVYSIDWALSDGTAATGVATSDFVITLPGDQTDAGFRLSVTGSVTGTATVGGGTCVDYVNYTEKIGDGDGFGYCDHEITNDQNVVEVTDTLQLFFDVDGVTESVSLQDTDLSIDDPSDYPSIETELEAIIPGSIVTISKTGTEFTISMENVPSFITDIYLFSDGSGLQTAVFDTSC